MGFSRDFGLILVGRDRSNRKVHTVCWIFKLWCGVVGFKFLQGQAFSAPLVLEHHNLQVWNIYRQAPKSLATLTPTLEAR